MPKYAITVVACLVILGVISPLGADLFKVTQVVGQPTIFRALLSIDGPVAVRLSAPTSGKWFNLAGGLAINDSIGSSWKYTIVPLVALTFGDTSTRPSPRFSTISSDNTFSISNKRWETENWFLVDYSKTSKKPWTFSGYNYFLYKLPAWALGVRADWKGNDGLSLYLGALAAKYLGKEAKNRIFFFWGARVICPKSSAQDPATSKAVVECRFKI